MITNKKSDFKLKISKNWNKKYSIKIKKIKNFKNFNLNKVVKKLYFFLLKTITSYTTLYLKTFTSSFWLNQINK